MEKVDSLCRSISFFAADNETANVHPQCMCTLLVYDYPEVGRRSFNLLLLKTSLRFQRRIQI